MKITLTKMSHYYENLARLKSEILELEEAITVNKLYLILFQCILYYLQYICI